MTQPGLSATLSAPGKTRPCFTQFACRYLCHCAYDCPAPAKRSRACPYPVPGGAGQAGLTGDTV